MLGELTKEQIEDVLTSNLIGRIGCGMGKKIYVVPVTYYYDGEYVIGHTTEGMKINFLRQNPECCFEVDERKSILNWQSVIAWGTFEELTGEEANKGREKLLDRLRPFIDSERQLQPGRMGPASAHRQSTQAINPIVYRIKLKEKSGRFEIQD